jgi:endonuclease/exonuclease/phosphatase family metal-dependent hydrolase
MSYNIQGLPFTPDPVRFTDIGSRLALARSRGTAPQIVALQEAFIESTDQVRIVSGYPYSYRAPEGFGLRQRGGLQILSELPIELASARVFRVCAGVDCLARKGVAHVRLRIAGAPFAVDFYTTHMQADYSDREPGQARGELLRERQLEQAFRFIDATRGRGNPVFFAGDFNFRPRERAFGQLKSETELQNTAELCLAREDYCGAGDGLPGTFPYLIDHLFFGGSWNGAVGTQALRFRQSFTDIVRGKLLSDHLAVEGLYRLSW